MKATKEELSLIAKYTPSVGVEAGTNIYMSDDEIIDFAKQYHAKMNANRKKLIQLRTKLEFYKKLDNKLEQVLNAKLEITDWSNEVYNKLSRFENELVSLKIEMDLSDEEWHEDESNEKQ